MPDRQSDRTGERALVGNHPIESGQVAEPRDVHGIGGAKDKGVMGMLANKSILVIDDDIRMLHALAKVLAGEGCAVGSAASSTIAMEYLLSPDRKIDLVITDIRMPLLDGMEVLDIVRTNRPTVPVILITAYGGPEAEAEARRLGAAAYLEKPVDSSELVKAICDVLSCPDETASS